MITNPRDGTDQTATNKPKLYKKEYIRGLTFCPLILLLIYPLPFRWFTLEQRVVSRFVKLGVDRDDEEEKAD